MNKENIFDYVFQAEEKDNKENDQAIKNYFKLVEIEEKMKKEGLENEALEVTSWYIYNIEYEEKLTERNYKVKNGKWKYKNEKEKIDFIKEIKDRTEKLGEINLNKQIIIDKIYWKKHWNQSLEEMEELGWDKNQEESDKINNTEGEVNEWLRKMLTEYKSAKNKKTKIKKKKNIKGYCQKNWIIIK